MKIRTALRPLAAAALLAVTVVTVFPGHADARRKTVNDYNCAIPGRATGSGNDWDFYSPNDNIVVGGVMYTCGSGVWIRW